MIEIKPIAGRSQFNIIFFGPQGAGKSTLLSLILSALRSKECTDAPAYDSGTHVTRRTWRLGDSHIRFVDMFGISDETLYLIQEGGFAGLVQGYHSQLEMGRPVPTLGDTKDIDRSCDGLVLTINPGSLNDIKSTRVMKEAAVRFAGELYQSGRILMVVDLRPQLIITGGDEFENDDQRNEAIRMASENIGVSPAGIRIMCNKQMGVNFHQQREAASLLERLLILALETQKRKSRSS